MTSNTDQKLLLIFLCRRRYFFDTGALGFYENEAERTPIVSVRIGADAGDLPAFEYLSTESDSFAAFADARANRRDPFFNVPAGGADICNIPVPVRRRAVP